MNWYLRKKHQQFRDFREKNLNKLLKAFLVIIVLVGICDTLTQTKTITIEVSNAVVVEAAAPVEDAGSSIIETEQAVKSQESNSQPSIQDKIREKFPECPDTMVAIAKAESHYNMQAENINKNGTKDCCILQINSVHGYDCERLKSDLDYCLDAGRKVYEKQGLEAWSTYNYAVKNNLPI